MPWLDSNGGPPALSGAFDYCRWLTARSGSHFSLSFGLLPADERQAMEAVYAYCRAIDDVVDQGSDPFLELKLWRQELAEAVAGCPTHPIAVALADVQERYAIPTEYFEKLIAGVEMDLGARRYATFEELRVYCERVASAVGLISVRIFGCVHSDADRYATALGIALQLTNILRDLKQDAQMGRIYLPLEDLSRFGVPEAELLNMAVRAEPKARHPEAPKGPKDLVLNQFQKLMAFECARARGFFSEAAQACRATGEAGKLLPARIMGAVYARLLRRIEESGYDVFSRRISIPRAEQMLIAGRCLLGLQ